jgi:hypothetical protein
MLPGVTEDRHFRRGLLFVFVLAVVLRAGFVVATHSDTLGTNTWYWGDEGADIARNILDGRGYVMSYKPLDVPGELFENVRSFRMPVLPLVLAGLWSLVGYNVLAAKFLMVFVSSMNCVLAGALGARWAGPRAGVLAAGLSAVFPNFIYWTGTLGAETLTMAFLLAGTLALVALDGWPRVLAGGVIVGLLGLTRPVYIPFAAGVAAIVFLSEPAGRRLVRTTTFLLTFLLVLSPWAARNWSIHHRFLLTSTEGGMTLLECNNPEAFRTGGDQITGFGLLDPVLAANARRAPEVDRDRLMYATAMRYIKADPWSYLRVSVLRIGYTWRLTPRTSAGGFGALHAIVMLCTWGWVFVLALVWAARQRVWRDPRHWIVLLAVLWVVAVSAGVRGAIRYRAPVEPFFVIYAAAALVPLSRKLVAERA